MFGQSGPKGPENNIEEAELARKEQVKGFFGGRTLEKKTLSGSEYLQLFRAGVEAGFTDSEFKTYLAEHGIRVDSGNPPEYPTDTIRYHTPE